MQETLGLWALFVSSFLAATVLPGGSEAVFFGFLKLHPSALWPALLTATLGNTLGGLSTYAIGRVLPQAAPDLHTRTGRWQQRTRVWAQRHGSLVLLGAWIPIIGDPLCLAAGWLRLKLLPVTLFMTAGKLARYLVIAWTTV
jgi:membrane protein YqaA with SNARE-associated domain